MFIGQRTFDELKFLFVKPMHECNTCYIYHVKIDELWIGLNNMQKKSQVYNHDSEACGVSTMFFKVSQLSQPHFGLSVRMKLTLPKVRTWNPLGLPKTQSLIAGVKTPRIGVFFIPLERS
jgi:hypothetical protein